MIPKQCIFPELYVAIHVTGLTRCRVGRPFLGNYPMPRVRRCCRLTQLDTDHFTPTASGSSDYLQMHSGLRALSRSRQGGMPRASVNPLLSLFRTTEFSVRSRVCHWRARPALLVHPRYPCASLPIRPLAWRALRNVYGRVYINFISERAQARERKFLRF